jgi:UDP:flavonoid glycosyltransferase YjiC (YdhE family)
MRALLTTHRGAGHFGPLVPFAHACRRAGHDVLVAGPPAVARLVARAGLPFHSVAEAPVDTVDAAFAPVWSQTASVDHVVTELFVGMHARTALPDMLATVAAWRPAVIVRETMEFASALAGDRHGVPQVRVGVHLASHIDAGGMLEEIAAPALGVPAERLRDSPLLTRSPASLNDRAEKVLRFRTDAAPHRPAAGGEPLVYISFGSEAPASRHFPGVYRRAVDALADLPVRVLVTIGDRRDPAELGPVPASVRVEHWVPQAEVMPRAAVMVSHGGSGSTLAALAGGVPQAFVPLFVDGPSNAARVAAAGAGIVAEDLAADVQTLLNDPRYGRAAAAIADEIRALPPTVAAIDVIQRSAAGQAIR